MSSAATDKAKVCFLGSGNMAQAMCNGFVSSGLLKPTQVTMSDPNGNQRPKLEPLGVNITSSNVTAVKESNVVFVAVKPHFVRKVLREIYDTITKDHVIISIAAGITLETMQQETPSGCRAVVVMPNTPSLVQCGASVYCLGTTATQEDGKLVKQLLASLGLVEEIPERLMPAVIGVSGSGTAYMYVAVEALSDAGVARGLPRALSTKLAAQMMMGAAKMVLETGVHPAQLKDNVCSPGGTTIAAIAELDRLGFRSALKHAVAASADRSVELTAIDKRAAAAEEKESEEKPRKKRAR